ncbi:hypothetical protein EBU71_02235 [bacterium]|nr:hypothetical protein [Candidatus Elulimicrobium humile]
MIHKIKRFFQKIGLSIYRKFHVRSGESVQEYSSEKCKIFRNLIRRQDSILLISPLSNRRFVRCDNLGIFIVLYDSKISIINHHYKYDLDLGDENFVKLSRLFDLQVESRRSTMQEDINMNVKHSLETIYQKLIHREKD